MENEQHCPICAAPTQYSPRYPRALCRSCSHRLTDAAGRPLLVGNTTALGAGVAAAYSPGELADLEKVNYGLIVYCDGIRCTANEAYFGGIVVQPAEDSALAGP